MIKNHNTMKEEIWPNFFIVGIGKSGTTTLYSYLNKTKGIYMSPVKEPGYFRIHELDHRYRKNPIVDEGKYLKLFSKMQFTKREKILSLFSFLNIFDFNMKYEVNKLDDIRPFIFEIRQYIKSIISK